MTYILIDTRPASRWSDLGLFARLRLWRDIAKERAQLAQMSPHELKDLGLTRLEAHREARRWFWDIRV